MPADEVTHGTQVETSRVRTGPRHAAPKKPLFTRFHMPAGKAIASVAMPTAVLMGMGFTSTFALADNNDTPPSSKSLTADEYKDCVAALDTSASPSPSGSPSASESAEQETPSPSATTEATGGAKDTSGQASSPDSGSDDKATPSPSASKSAPSASGSDVSGSGTTTTTPSPTASSGGGSLLDAIGDAITGIFTGAGVGADSSASASPTPSASASAAGSEASKDSGDAKDSGGSATDAVKDTADKVTKTVEDTVKDTTDTASEAAEDATGAAQEPTESATASPSPSASASASAADCPVATDDMSGVDNKTPVADEPWYLDASSLLLKNADYQGIVEVKRANGTTKKVLKYVISGGTDIGDLHQTVKDKQIGKTYHVQAAAGSMSTIRDGDTVMYTESISGNLFGLIPVTFSPDSPPPLNIPLIYFTHVKVIQAAQFGGTLHVPGMHVYTTD
ncbi:hypothetical protein [Streptomyces shenzhenensis]|uniref:Membrane-bound hydrophilic protein n=1 Tax=Streptomyces shenzhenensis TaxID=943815 RepID=A0A3M0I469_9ACTN|nr:hypothetical protein [Streptomyces shenzhenensis]RMB80879.1 hypothetical protein CTZ28_37455 [Streptomyces shenzhenensis]